MKKKDLKKLALLGLIVASQGVVHADETTENEIMPDLKIAAGCGGGCSHGAQKKNYQGCSSKRQGCSSMGHSCGSSRGFVADADENAKDENAKYDNSGQLMTEDQLMSQLNEQSKQMYRSMDPEGKALAIKLASRSCKGTNDCKGQGSCKTSDHSCAGKNSCAGTSKCSFKDKNLAVKVAYQKQSEKRMQTNSGSY